DSVASERLMQAYRITSAKDDDTFALDVLANILFEGTSSRAWRLLVERENIALQVGGASYTPTYPGLFIVSAVMRGELPASRAERSLVEAIAEVQRDGVSDEEVAIAVRQLTVELVNSVRTSQGLANLIGTVATTLGDPGAYRDDLEK